MESETTKHILIVEPEAGVRELLSDLLELHEYQVKALTSGQEVIDCLSEPLDLLILEVRLPDPLTSYELCQIFKQRKKLAQIPIILMSSLLFHIARKCTRIPEVVYYLTKPYVLETLLRIIDRCLNPNRNASTPLDYSDHR